MPSLDQRNRLGVEQEVSDETSPARAQNAADFGEIILQGIGEEVSKNRGEKNEIEGIVLVGKAKILGTILAQRAVKLVVQVSKLKVEIRKAAGDVLAYTI